MLPRAGWEIAANLFLAKAFNSSSKFNAIVEFIFMKIGDIEFEDFVNGRH